MASSDNSELDSYAAFRRVSQRPTDTSAPYDHYAADAVVDGGCVDWIEYWKGGALEEQLYGSSPDIITVFSVRATTPAGALEAQLTDPRNVSCTESGKPQLIVEQLTQTAATLSTDAISCNNRDWVVNPCGDSGSPALCVGCSEDMIDSMCNTSGTDQDIDVEICDIGDDDDYTDDSGAIYIGPCQQSLCSLRRAHSMGHLVVSRGRSSSPPPVLQNTTTVTTSKNAITITAQVDAEGIVVCDAFAAPAGETGGPSNVNQVLLGGVSSSVVVNQTENQPTNYYAAVVITDLAAATTYFPYCATKSALDIPIDYDDMVAQADNAPSMRNATTQCCREVSLNILSSSVSAGSDAALFEDVLSVQVESAPAAGLTVSFALVSWDTNTSYSAFAPSSKFYSSQSSQAQLSSTMGLYLSTSSVPSGKYFMRTSLSGVAAGMYSVDYGNGNRNITVISQDTEMPLVPELQEVAYSEDGTYIGVIFTGATDRAGRTGDFTCDKLFEFTSASSSSCAFTSNSALQVTLPDLESGDTLPDIGDAFSLKAGKIKATCTTGTGCADYAYTAPATITGTGLGLSTTIQTPSSPVIPAVVVSSPKRIGNCDSFTVTLTSSTGNAGRDWVTTTFSVTSTDEESNSHEGIEAWLRASYVMAPPNAISKSLMVPGNMYSMTITLCNFLGSCGVTTHSWTVLTRSKPQVVVLGSSLRSITRDDQLDLSVAASISVCSPGSDGTTTSSGLTYTWSVVDMNDGNNLDELVAANTARSASRFTLAPYTLSTGQSLEVEVKVYSESEGTSSYYSVSVEVVAGDLAARITDFSNRLNIVPRKTIAIDGSASYDEDSEYLYRLYSKAADDGGRGSMLRNMSFTWSCETTKPVYQEGCASYLLLSNYSSSSTPWLLSVYAHSAAEGSTSKITLVVSDPSTSRSSKVSLAVYGLTSGAPILRVFKKSKGKGSANLLDGRRKVKLSATAEAPDFSEADIDSSEGELAWSVDRSSGLNLRRQSLSPLSRSITLTSEMRSAKLDLVLKPESLGAARDYTFYLSFTSTTGVFVESSVTVEANRPPSMGRIAISPRAGTELETEFTIVAYLWTDSDLPLTYEPFLAHPSMRDMNIILQSRSDKTSVTTKLPGRSVESDEDGVSVAASTVSEGGNATQRIGLKVFDSLGAYARRHTRVVIMPRVIPDREVSEFIEDSVLGAATPDAAKSIAVTASLQINKVDCSGAPNCTLLNREDCSSHPHTCGACLEDYLGTAGYHNSKCASAELFLADYESSSGDDDYYFDDDDDGARRRELESPRGMAWPPPQQGAFPQQRNGSNISGRSNFIGVTRTPLVFSMGQPRELSTSCAADADCESVGPWHSCSTTGVCEIPLAPCANGCSGNGYCAYYDSRTEEHILACYVGEPSCTAQCKCDEGWYGPACLSDDVALYDRMNSRLTILQTMQYLVDNDELTAENVNGWVELLGLAADDPSELAPASVELLSNLTSSILEAASTVNNAIVTTTVGEEEDDSSTVGYEQMLPLLELMSVISDMQDQTMSPYAGHTEYPTSAPTSFLRRELEEDGSGENLALSQERAVASTVKTVDRRIIAHHVCSDVMRRTGLPLSHFDWSRFNVSEEVDKYIAQHPDLQVVPRLAVLPPQSQPVTVTAPERPRKLQRARAAERVQAGKGRILVELASIDTVSAVTIDPRADAKAFSRDIADMALGTLSPGEDGISSAFDNLRLTTLSANTYSSASSDTASTNSTSRLRLLGEQSSNRRLDAEEGFLGAEEEDYIFLQTASSDTELLSVSAVNYVALVNLSTSSSIGADDTSALKASLISTPAHLMNASTAVMDTGDITTSVPTLQPSVLPLGVNASTEITDYSDSTDNFGYANLTGDRSIASSSLDFRLDCDAGGFSDVTVYFTLYHDHDLSLYNSSHGEVSRLNHTTVCKRKYPSVHEYYCPDSNDMVTAVCTGRRETIVTHCPQIERVTHCAMVDPDTGAIDASASASAASSCAKNESLSNGNVTVCSCNMCGASDRRRLSTGDGLDPHDEVELVTLVSYSTTDMMTSIVQMSTSSSLDDSMAGPYPVLITFMCVWLLLPLAVWMHRTRVQQKKKGSKRKQENKVVPDTGYTADQDAGDNEGALKNADGLRIGDGGADARGGRGDGQRQVIEAFGAYVTSVIPDVFAAHAPQQRPVSSSPLANIVNIFNMPKKMWNELTQHHIYGHIVSSDDPGKAFVKLAHALTAVTVVLFVLAVLYDMQFPDDVASICSAHTGEEACLAEAAPLDDSYKRCTWDAEYRECTAHMELVVPHTTYLVLTIWFCVVAVPLLLLQEYLFTHILAAPTAADLDQQERKAFLYSALKMVKAVKPNESLDKHAEELVKEYDEAGEKDGSTDLGSRDTEKAGVPEHYHAALMADMHHHAQHHLKQGRLHAKTRHKKLQHRNEKMLKLVKRQKQQQQDSEDADGGDDEHERERMVSRAVLTSPHTQRLQAALGRALNTSLLARTQIDAVRKRYLSQQALHFLKYEDEKKSALSQQRRIKMASNGLDMSAAADGSMITARGRRNMPPDSVPSTEQDDESIDTAPIYGASLDLDSDHEGDTTAGGNLRDASLAITEASEVHGDEDDISSDDSLGSWASDDTNIHDDTAAKKKRRERRKRLAQIKEKLRPNVMAHLRSSTRLERFQQKRELLHREALVVNKQFHRDLIRYRNGLRYREQVRELDQHWALTAINTGASGRGMNAGLGVRNKKGEDKFCFDAKAEVVMAAEIEKALKGASKSISMLRSLPPSLRGPELLRIFVLDLLGRDTMAAKVMKTKMYANTYYHVVSNTAKITAGIAVALINFVMLYVVLSYASTKSAMWQQAWLVTAFANVAVHLGLNQAMEALLLHYYIPQLVYKEASAVRQKLLDIVDALFRETLIGEGAGEDEAASGSGGFSQTSFFFVAHQVASQSPDLHEAALVLSHRDALPLPSLREKWYIASNDKSAQTPGVAPGETSKKSRHLTSQDIRRIAGNRLHERYSTDQERTLTGRLFIARQVLQLHSLKYLSVLTEKVSRMLMGLGSLDVKMQRLLIQVIEPIVIAMIVFGAVQLQKEQGDWALPAVTAGFFALLFVVFLWVRWAGTDKHQVAPNAILPAPGSGKKKKDKKDKGKYGSQPSGGSPLHRASSLFAGGDSAKEGSLLDDHASVDDLLSDLGSIQQVEDERSISSTSSGSSGTISKSDDGSSIDTDDLGTITNSSDDEAAEENRIEQQKSAFEAGVAAGIAAAAGAGVVTVPVTIRSKSTGTASTVAPSEGYEKPQAGHPYDDQDLDADFDLDMHGKPGRGLHQGDHDHGSDSDSFDSYDPHRRYDGKQGIEDSASGEEYEHHLSKLIREHTIASNAHRHERSGGMFSKPKKAKKHKHSAMEAALKPFEAPVRDKTFKGLTGTYDREMAELTQRGKAKSRRKVRGVYDSDSDIEGSDDSGALKKPQGIGTRGAGGEFPAENPDPSAGRKLLYEEYMNSGQDFKVGKMRTMNISHMHKNANLHIQEAIKGKANVGSATHTSSQVTVTESPSTSDDEAGRGEAAVTIRHATSTPAPAPTPARAGVARQATSTRRASHMSPHIRDLGSILGGHQSTPGEQLIGDDEESL